MINVSPATEYRFFGFTYYFGKAYFGLAETALTRS